MKVSFPLWRLAAPCLALAALLLPEVSQAQSAGTVRVSASGQCMDVNLASLQLDAPIIQWPCTGTTNQLWQLDFGAGYYTFRVAHSGQCLDVFKAGGAAGTPLVQWNCTGSTNQQFALRPQGDGFALVARHSNLCISNAGQQLTQQACDGSPSQTWNVPFNTSLQSVGTGQCIDVQQASTQLDAAVIQWPCAGSANQQWQAVQADGYYTLKAAHSGQCLDVYQAGGAAGTPLVQWNCTGSTNQQFQMRAQGAGFALVARHSGQCVAVAAGSQAPATVLVQQPCNGSAAQTWSLAGLSNAGRVGRWGPVQNLSLVPVAAANLPDGNVLFWSAFDRFNFSGDNNGRTYTTIFNPQTGVATERLVTNTGHDMFCPGIVNLPDGRIQVTGGSGARNTSIYNPATNAWVAAAPMNIPRGYQGAVTLSNGNVFTIGGSWSGGQGNKDAEVWSPVNGAWRRTVAVWDDYMLTNDAQGVYRADNHAWLFATSGGRVFHAGPSKRMNFFDTNGNGGVTSAGNRAADGDAMNGNAVMIDANKILTTGGAPNYQNNDATGNAHLISIGGNAVNVKQLRAMNYARAFHNSVVLPDGKVLIVGGQTYPVPFSDDRAVLVPELFNPSTETFTPMATMGQARTYHSVALLLPDARVLSGGGGLCGNCATNHPNVQVWSPPYLFNADGTPAQRPVLTAAPATATAGTRMTVNTDSAVTAFSLIRLSSVTHSVNNEQRRVSVGYTATGTNQYALDLVGDRGVLVPGFYMLFALNAKGVPSVARTIRIN